VSKYDEDGNFASTNTAASANCHSFGKKIAFVLYSTYEVDCLLTVENNVIYMEFVERVDGESTGDI